MTNSEVDVAVVGGGLAGCAAATLLARAGLEVALFESGSYPRHKICGEFLSPESFEVLQRMGAADVVDRAGPKTISFARISSGNGAEVVHPLSQPGRSLRRYVLDELLFKGAREAGVDCRSETLVRDISGTLDEGFRISGDGIDVSARVVLGAFGKQSIIDRTIGRPRVGEVTPYLGFKQYFLGDALDDAVHLYAAPGGYCGMVRVEDGSTNVCWMIHRDILAKSSSPLDTLGYFARHNVHFRDRLSILEPVDDQLLATSNLSFRTAGLIHNDILMIGDAAGMISPLCGDGMAMALHGGSIAADKVAAFLDGRLSGDRLRRSYRSAWEREFRNRMAFGRLFQSIFIGPAFVSRSGIRLMGRVPAVARWVLAATRG